MVRSAQCASRLYRALCRCQLYHSHNSYLYLYCILYFVFHDLYSVFCICISEKCTVCILALQSTVSLSALSQSQHFEVSDNSSSSKGGVPIDAVFKNALPFHVLHLSQVSLLSVSPPHQKITRKLT